MHQLPDLHPMIAVSQSKTLAVDFGGVLPSGVTLVVVPSAPTITLTTDNGTDATPQDRLTVGPSIGTLSVADGGTGVANAALFFQLSALVLGASYLLVYSSYASNGDRIAAFNHIRAVGPASVTLVAEDGSGDPTANSYIDVAFADTYHSNRGNEYWMALSLNNKKACLIRATDYIDKRFGDRFRGFRMQKDQALAWPRLSAFDDDDFTLDDVPTGLQKATAEYGLRAAIYNVLAPDPVRTTPSQDMSDEDTPNESSAELIVGPLKSKTEKVGPIQKSVTYEGVSQLTQANQRSTRAGQSTTLNDIYIPQYPEADLLIERLLDNETSTRLERA
jgi:hypothetical protein